ncbi:hypothetical protein BV898_19718, partial [Hypsibius exemplaris]
FSIIETRYYFDGVDYEQKLHERYMEFIGTQKLSEFHTYLIRWTETHVTWHINGKQIFTLRKTTDQKFPSKPMHVSMTPLINQFLAPSNPSSDEHETYPSWRSVVMEIDYHKPFGFVYLVLLDTPNKSPYPMGIDRRLNLGEGKRENPFTISFQGGSQACQPHAGTGRQASP